MWQLFIANVKMLIRNRQFLFWAMAFPLIFTTIFGAFFGKGSTGGGSIAVYNESDSQISTGLVSALNSSSVKVVNVTSIDDGTKQMDSKAASALLIIPQNFGLQITNAPTSVELRYDPTDVQSVATFKGVINGYLTQMNFTVAQVIPRFSITDAPTSGGDFSYFDFVLIGLIGMAVMNASVQGIAVQMSEWRESKILKRITTTPIKTWQFILAQIGARLCLATVQIGLVLFVGIKLFGGHVHGSIPVVVLLGLLGALMFQLLGFVIAALTKTVQAAEGMATAVTIPLMFLSGVFFPIDSLPKWLHSIVVYLPLAPLLSMLRNAGLKSVSPLSDPNQMAFVLVWVVILLVIASMRFRLEEE